MCDDCVSCDGLSIDFDYYDNLARKYKTRNFEELMDADRNERRKLLKKYSRGLY